MISELLQLPQPILQAPMLGVTTPEMVAAASKAQCLGSLPLGDLPVQAALELLHKTKTLTSYFAVNIFTHELPEKTTALEKQYEKVKAFMEELMKRNGFYTDLPSFESLSVSSYSELIDIVLEENCPVLSFTFGPLATESIRKLHENKTVVIGSCTSVREAVFLEQSGVDIICVQGIEAGGHRGSFEDKRIPEIGGMALLPQVKKAVSLPLIYAGGIYTAETYKAARILGASAVQLGTLLLTSKESALSKAEKERLMKVAEKEIVLTKSFSGRYARGIENTFVKEVEAAAAFLPYPYQNKLTQPLRKAAREKQLTEFVNLWVGQSVPEFQTGSTQHILENFIRNTDNCISFT